AKSTATVTMTIAGQNDGPVATDVTDNVAEHGPAKIVTPSFIDPDVGDTHTFTIRSEERGVREKGTINADGTFSYDHNGRFISLKAGDTATDKCRYTVTDGSGAKSTATVTMTIRGENDGPVAADVADSVAEHGPAKTVTPSFTDPDVGDTHTFTI